MPEAPTTVTIPDVELLRVGTWAASTGVTTVTPEDLEAMVAAAGDDEIDGAPLKLGHTGALASLGDSEPALGWVANLRVAQDGQTLLGDLVDVPAAMEAPIKAGFKRRSVEIAWGVTTPSGATYRAALSGLALLGVAPPAVKGLADIAALYQPAKTAASGLQCESLSALALWDPATGAEEPTFAERVRDQLRWARESAASLAALVGLEGLQAVFDALDAMAARGAGGDSRNFSAGDPDHGGDGSNPEGRMADMKTAVDIAELRKVFGIAEDVPDDQVLTKCSELKARVEQLEAAAKGAPGGTGGDTVVEEPKVPAAALSADTVKALKDAGLTVITDSAFAELQAGAAAGAQAASQLAATRREAILEGAQRAGKFGGGEQAVTTRSKFAALLEADEAGTVALLETLPALVPISELGSDSPGPDTPALLSENQIDKALADFFGEPLEQES